MTPRKEVSADDELKERARTLLETFKRSTWGKIVLLLVGLYTMFLSWINFGPTAEAHDQRLAAQDERISAVEEDTADVQLQMASLKSDVAAVQTDVVTIQTGVDDLNVQLVKARKLIEDLQDIRDDLLDTLQSADGG